LDGTQQQGLPEAINTVRELTTVQACIPT